MPKIPSRLKQPDKSEPKHKCGACGGSGKASSGSRCLPCNGKGVPYSWNCTSCGARHDGIYNQVCRNPKCKLYNKLQ